MLKSRRVRSAAFSPVSTAGMKDISQIRARVKCGRMQPLAKLARQLANARIVAGQVYLESPDAKWVRD